MAGDAAFRLSPLVLSPAGATATVLERFLHPRTPREAGHTTSPPSPLQHRHLTLVTPPRLLSEPQRGAATRPDSVAAES